MVEYSLNALSTGLSRLIVASGLEAVSVLRN